MRKALASTIPDYMMPSAFVSLEALPQTPNGKTDRLRLPAPSHRRPALDVAYAEPRGLMEEGLSRIWSEVLAIDAVGVDDNFFELGGDSLLATKMAVRALNELKVEVSLKMLFRSPTIAKLAAEIDEVYAKKTTDVERNVL
jgi:acyl carrier protein